VNERERYTRQLLNNYLTAKQETRSQTTNSDPEKSNGLNLLKILKLLEVLRKLKRLPLRHNSKVPKPRTEKTKSEKATVD